MSEGPKLFMKKPKKSKRKVNQQGMTSSSSAGIGTTPPPPPPPPPPTPTPPVKESFIRRYKFLWPLILAANITIGVYVFTRTTKKDVGTDEAELPTTLTSTTKITETTAPTVTETLPVNPPVIVHVPRTPIPDDQQRELFKWILEDKRKIKPRDAEEKRKIEEEKAILKQFIRAKALPTL